MRKFVIIRNVILVVFGVWLFEFYLDYKLPEENNLLLFFVAIPIIWATITQLWTSYSYTEINDPILLFCNHVLSMLMLFGTVFLVCAVLNTISDILDPVGIFMFHAVGWTVIAAIIMYDIVDAGRLENGECSKTQLKKETKE
jgi:hypothetical protein